MKSYAEKTGVPEGFRNPPGELMGHMGLGGKREGRPGWAARPLSLWSELDKEGGAPLPFPLLVGVGKEESYSY